MGVIVLLPTQIEEETRDFDQYGGYINGIGLIYHDGPGGGPAQNQSVQLRPVRQDTGSNPNETRPESGDIFSQGDFSNGQDQQFFHLRGSDPARFLYGEGTDIEVFGKLRHVRSVIVIPDISSPRAMTQAGGNLFVTDGVNVKSTADIVSFMTENPHDGATPETVHDLTSSGDEVYAAVGGGGLHRRDAAGAWAHYQVDDPLVDVDTGDTRKVRWLRSRLIVVGGAGRILYEVTPAGVTELETLPAGWEFADVAEAGAFIYAAAINVAGNRSRVHHYGLSNAGALEAKGGFDLPVNQLCRSVRGFLGRALLGVGKFNDQFGYDPVTYQAGIDGSGGLFIETKVAEGKAGVHDLGVRAIEPIGESVLIGWSLSSDAPFGAREGLAEIYPARGAFANSLSVVEPPLVPEAVRAISVFKGRTVYITGDQMMSEDRDAFRSEMVMISSIGTWANAGVKTWDTIEVTHRALPAGCQIAVYYSSKHPEEDDWHLAGANQTPGSERASFILESVDSPLFAIKIISRAAADTAPEILTFSVRSNPAVASENAEWVLVRHIRIAAEDQQDSDAPVVRNTDPNAAASRLEDLLFKWVTFYEQPATYRVRVEAIETTRISEPNHDSTQGESSKNVFYMQIALKGTKVAQSQPGSIHLA